MNDHEFKTGDHVMYLGGNKSIVVRKGARAKVRGVSKFYINISWYPEDKKLVGNQCSGGYLPKYFKKINHIG